MTETERLRIQLQAAEAEILRLQGAIDQIRNHVVEMEWSNDWNTINIPDLLKEIDKITKPL